MERSLWGAGSSGNPCSLDHCPAHILDLVLAFLALPSVSWLFFGGILWTEDIIPTHWLPRAWEESSPSLSLHSLLSRVWFLTNFLYSDFPGNLESFHMAKGETCVLTSLGHETRQKQEGGTGREEGRNYWKLVIFRREILKTGYYQHSLGDLGLPESRLLKMKFVFCCCQSVHFTTCNLSCILKRIKSNTGLVQGRRLPPPFWRPLEGSPSPSQLLRSILFVGIPDLPLTRWKG